MKRVIVGLVLLLGMHAAIADGGRETVEIRVAHLAKNRWQAQYHLEEPASRLRFTQEYGARRHERWTIDTRGLRLVADSEGREYLESISGKPFRDASLHFESDISKLAKDYPLNKRFTDGSQWLCLLHLYAAPMRGEKDADTSFHVHLIPRRSEGVVLGGRRYARATTWIDPHNDRGTFAYFGKLQPIESPDVIAIVDPGLPDYLKKIFEKQLPELFGYFHEKTGYALPIRPEILISYYPEDDVNQGDSGDVLPDVIAFDLRSRRLWGAPNAGNARTSFHLLAHEAAHLWNGSRFEPVESNDAAWMHEGGADAFDWAAARDFGVLDDQSLRNELEQKLNGCLYQLAPLGVSLQEAFRKQIYDLAYSCGSVMSFAVDAELRNRGGLFAFWRALFAKAAQSGNRYSVEQYFATLRELDAGGSLADAMSDLWTKPQSDLAEALRAMLASAGIVLAPGKVPPDFEQLYARKAMNDLLWEDCGGGFSFSTSNGRFQFTGLPQCHILKNRKVTVTTLAGASVADPSRLYEAVRKSCAEEHVVSAQLADNDEIIALPCSKSLPEIEPYLVITRWPH